MKNRKQHTDDMYFKDDRGFDQCKSVRSSRTYGIRVQLIK